MILTIPSNNARFRGGLPPLVERIRKQDPEGAWSVLEYGNRTEGLAANDNFASADDDDGNEAQTDVFEVERRHRMRPSPDDMVSSVHRARVVTEKRSDGGPGRSRVILHRYPGYDDTRVDGDRVFLANMVFSTDPTTRRPEAGGLMLSFAGREPEVDTKTARGGASPGRSAAAVTRYLERPPAEPSTAGYRTPLSDTPAICTMNGPLERSEKLNRFGVEEGRALMREHQIDGTVSFDDARRNAGLPPIARGETAVAAGAGFLGGVVRGNDDSPSRGPMFVADDPRESLTERTVAVLEEALARGTLTDVGISLGYASSYAAKAAGRAFAAAVAEVKRVLPAPIRAANDNRKLRCAVA